MAEFDYLTIILPTVLASITTFIVLGIKKLGTTSDGTLSGTIRLEHVQTNVDSLQKNMDKGFEKIENILNENDRENRATFNKIWQKFEELNTDIKLHEYRLNQHDHKRGTNGGERSPV